MVFRLILDNVRKYKLEMVRKRMESFDVDAALLVLNSPNSTPLVSLSTLP
jgi:hypothetical protein